ncbi:hypothetical protein C5167_004180 [Papaver somniferum]|nr:hypothetical protein C5167_004180 [Papaver somniferum]
MSYQNPGVLDFNRNFIASAIKDNNNAVSTTESSPSWGRSRLEREMTSHQGPGDSAPLILLLLLGLLCSELMNLCWL